MMADISRQEKLASARKKLKQFQQERSQKYKQASHFGKEEPLSENEQTKELVDHKHIYSDVTGHEGENYEPLYVSHPSVDVSQIRGPAGASGPLPPVTNVLEPECPEIVVYSVYNNNATTASASAEGLHSAEFHHSLVTVGTDEFHIPSHHALSSINVQSSSALSLPVQTASPLNITSLHSTPSALHSEQFCGDSSTANILSNVESLTKWPVDNEGEGMGTCKETFSTNSSRKILVAENEAASCIEEKNLSSTGLEEVTFDDARESESNHSDQLQQSYCQLADKSNEMSPHSFRHISSNSSKGSEDSDDLQKQLQLYAQTVAILVAEKSELETSLTKIKKTLECKTDEVNELRDLLLKEKMYLSEAEDKLKECRHENGKLIEAMRAVEAEFQSLRDMNLDLSRDKEELQSQVSELREKLLLRCKENEAVTNALNEANNRVSMAELHIQQLQNGSSETLQSHIKQLEASLSRTKQELSESLDQMEDFQRERISIISNYKMHSSQLIKERDEANKKLKQVLCEKEEDKALIKQLQEKLNDVEKLWSEASVDCSEEMEEKGVLIKKLESEVSTIAQENASLKVDNSNLSQLIEEQAMKIHSLELEFECTKIKEVDTSQLLLTMESDKVAASRALSQNKILKNQVEELQDGLIMLSNKKLELAERLEREVFHKKTLNQKIENLSKELSCLREQRNDSEKALLVLEENDQSISQETTSSGASASCQEPCSDQMVVTEHLTEDEIQANSKEEDHDASDALEVEENGIDNISELEEKFETLEAAHTALEMRFERSMHDVAQLTEDKHQLEHLVQQLQVETDTIGDYITIYQFQRGVLKQQVKEFEQEVKSLRREKTEMTDKLSLLQTLVKKLASSGEAHEEVMKDFHSLLQFSDGSSDTSSTVEAKLEAASPAEDNAVPLSGTEHKERDLAKVSLQEATSQEQSKLDKSTVKQILDLISEMESSTSVDHSALQKFHPCPLCHGKLITV